MNLVQSANQMWPAHTKCWELPPLGLRALNERAVPIQLKLPTWNVATCVLSSETAECDNTNQKLWELPSLGLRALNEREIARRIELYAMSLQSHAACGPKMLDAATQTTCWELPPLGLRKLNLRDVETLKILCEELFHARYFWKSATQNFEIAVHV